MPKTLRFQDLVAKAGRPQAVTLWTDPGSDPSFTRAIKENRVLTLIQPRRTKHKEYGIVGFHEDPHASYLMFPRSLPENGDLRVIGIKYDLVDERAVGKAVLPKAVKRDKKKPSPVEQSKSSSAQPPLPVQPIQKKFTVHLRRTATLDASMTVLAHHQKEATQQALESVKRKPFGSNDSGVREQTEITRVEGKD
jgi:hypothetical protein